MREPLSDRPRISIKERSFDTRGARRPSLDMGWSDGQVCNDTTAQMTTKKKFEEILVCIFTQCMTTMSRPNPKMVFCKEAVHSLSDVNKLRVTPFYPNSN